MLPNDCAVSSERERVGFSDCPREIRQAIWGIVLRTPRRVKLSFTMDQIPYHHRYLIPQHDNAFQVQCDNRNELAAFNPVRYVLAVNRESNAIAHNYRTSVLTKTPGLEDSLRVAKLDNLNINPELDILFLQNVHVVIQHIESGTEFATEINKYLSFLRHFRFVFVFLPDISSSLSYAARYHMGGPPPPFPPSFPPNLPPTTDPARFLLQHISGDESCRVREYTVMLANERCSVEPESNLPRWPDCPSENALPTLINNTLHDSDGSLTYLSAVEVDSCIDRAQKARRRSRASEYGDETFWTYIFLQDLPVENDVYVGSLRQIWDHLRSVHDEGFAMPKLPILRFARLASP